MKISIATIQYTKNIGGCLQALALQEHLQKRYKASVKIIDYRPNVITDIYQGWSIAKYGRMLKNEPIKQLLRTIASDIAYAAQNRRIDEKFAGFYKKYYKLTSPSVYTLAQLREQKNDADILMTGSDQVWNDKLFHGFDPVYFLKFGSEKQKRVAYAASIGNDTIDEKQLAQFKELLKGYSYISTREKQAQLLLQPASTCKIETVLDPTLLMTGDEWLTLFKDGIEVPKEPYIFYYTINWSETAFQFAEQLSKQTGLPVVTALARKRFTNECMHHGKCTPDDFVKLVSGAQYVVTNSFHGTVFSILFEKQFRTFLNSTRNSRIQDLLAALNIENHTTAFGELPAQEMQKIDYIKVNERLEKLRMKSNTFLDNAVYGGNVFDDKSTGGIG